MESRTRQSWLKSLSIALMMIAAFPIAHQLYAFDDLTVRQLFWLIAAMFVVGIPAFVLTIQAALELRNADSHS